MLDWDALQPERPRPLRRVEYDRLVDAGVFEDERIELLHGVLVTMSPQGDDHASGTAELARLLYVQLIELGSLASVDIRSHSPFAASDDSEPEPDLVVTPRRPHERGHPARAHLVAEVSVSSLRKDRTIKAGIYAEAGVPEYWIVDVAARSVEVHTEPSAGIYRASRRYGRGEILRPIELPGVAIAVDDLFAALPVDR